MTTTLALKPIEIENADSATLRRELLGAMTMTARQLGYLAAIWRELDRRGEDLSDLRSGLAAYLPLIARGTLHADMVVKYAGQKMLLAAVARLPMPEQQRLAEAGYVTLVGVDGEGGQMEVQTALHRLSAADVRHVFAEHRLRTSAEQFTLLVKKPKRSTPVRKFRKARRVELDPHDRSIIVGSASVTVDKLLPALSQYFGFDVGALLKKSTPGAG